LDFYDQSLTKVSNENHHLMHFMIKQREIKNAIADEEMAASQDEQSTKS